VKKQDYRHLTGLLNKLGVTKEFDFQSTLDALIKALEVSTYQDLSSGSLTMESIEGCLSNISYTNRHSKASSATSEGVL